MAETTSQSETTIEPRNPFNRNVVHVHAMLMRLSVSLANAGSSVAGVTLQQALYCGRDFDPEHSLFLQRADCIARPAVGRNKPQGAT